MTISCFGCEPLRSSMHTTLEIFNKSKWIEVFSFEISFDQRRLALISKSGSFSHSSPPTHNTIYESYIFKRKSQLSENISRNKKRKPVTTFSFNIKLRKTFPFTTKKEVHSSRFTSKQNPLMFPRKSSFFSLSKPTKELSRLLHHIKCFQTHFPRD